MSGYARLVQLDAPRPDAHQAFAVLLRAQGKYPEPARHYQAFLALTHKAASRARQFDHAWLGSIADPPPDC